MARERKIYPSDTMDAFNARLPEGLRDKLRDAAKASGRSMNSELVHRLEESFDTKRQIAPAIAEFIELHVQAEVKARLQAIASHLGDQSQT